MRGEGGLWRRFSRHEGEVSRGWKRMERGDEGSARDRSNDDDNDEDDEEEEDDDDNENLATPSCFL